MRVWEETGPEKYQGEGLCQLMNQPWPENKLGKKYYIHFIPIYQQHISCCLVLIIKEERAHHSRKWRLEGGNGVEIEIIMRVEGCFSISTGTCIVVTALYRARFLFNPLYSPLALTKWSSLPVFHLSAQNACIKEIGMFHRMQNASHMKSLQKRVWGGTDHFSLCDHLVAVTTKYYVVTIKILPLLSSFPSHLKCLSSWRHHYTSWQIWVADVTWGCLSQSPTFAVSREIQF